MPQTIDHTLEAVLDDGTKLQVKRAGIGMDRGWSPYVQSSITAVYWPGAETLDPRATRRRLRFRGRTSPAASERVSAISAAQAGNTLAQFVGEYGPTATTTLADISAYYSTQYTAPSTPGTTRLFDLGIRECSINRRDGTVDLVLESDEALAQDYRLIETPALPAPNLQVPDITNGVLQRIDAQLYQSAGITPLTTAPDWIRGTTAWNYLQTIHQPVNQAIWCDEQRHWYSIAGRLNPDVYPDPGLVIELDGAVNTTNVIDVKSRTNGWADAVVVVYEWTDNNGVRYYMEDVAFNIGWSRSELVRIESPYPGPGAARFILERRLADGHQETVTATTDYRATPGRLVEIPTAGGTAMRVIQSVRWEFPSDTMTVTTLPE